MPAGLPERIRAYIADRKALKLEELEKQKKEREKLHSLEALSDFDAKIAEKQTKLVLDFTPANWLDNAAKRAGQISMATHALKFTHSAAKGSNFLSQSFATDHRYLDTDQLAHLAIDAVGNAAALDVATLLQLTDDNAIPLFEYLKKDDMRPLAEFAKTKEQLIQWQAGLKNALLDKMPTSHTLAKQIYFPVGDDGYHLLSPLYSSSLSQALYDEIRHSRFSQEMKQIRSAKKNNTPCEMPLVIYPDLAFTVSGGSKPQNISKLNSSRAGRTYLFNAKPPRWEDKSINLENNRLKNLDSLFGDKTVNYQTRREIKRISAFLIKNLGKDSNQARRARLNVLVEQTIEQLINSMAPWQKLPAGWTNNLSNLPLHQKRWLDPNNEQWQMDNLDWINPLANEFGHWLKDRVEQEAKGQFYLSVGEADEWRQCAKQILWEAQA